MKQSIKIFLFSTCILLATSLLAQKGTIPKQRDKVEINIPKKNFHLYLLIGQSNMAGRGVVEPQDTIANKRILRLNKNGDWEIAKEPVQFDKKEAGVGPSLSFARKMLQDEKDTNVVIGLIPAAAGGSGLDIWLKDLYWEQTQSTPYNNAILRAKLALKDGVLKGILWHQGEADCSPTSISTYKDRLITLIDRLRKEFKSPNVPFIAGELPEYNPGAVNFNPGLYEVKNSVNNYDVVSGAGLTSNPDHVHIDAASQRIFGERYAEKMESVQNKNLKK